MLTERTQRWRERREKMIPGATEIRASEFSVDVIKRHSIAAAFVQQHHYTGSMPSVRLACGLYRNGPGGISELCGVIAFSTPCNNASVPKNAGLDNHLAACDLGRLVLLDDVAGNGETFFLSRAMKLLRREKPEIISVISYADPMKRIDSSGKVYSPGHVGKLYQVAAARYLGTTAARTNLFMPNGKVFSPRTMSKLMADDSGRDGAEQQLLSANAPKRHEGQEIASWVQQLMDEGFFKKQRHPGNHTYLFPMTIAAKIAASRLPSKAYPVLDRSGIAENVTALPLLQAA